YRRALDAIAAGKEYKSFGAYQDLRLAFNRGYTSGYLFEKFPAALMGTDASDNRGICIGHVRRYDAKSKTISFRSDRSPVPSPGDGILLTHPKNPCKEYGFSLNTLPVQKDGEMVIRVPHPVDPGTGVFITSSSDLEQRARQIIAHPPAGLLHPVPVDLDVRVGKGGNLVIEGLIHIRSGGVIPLVYRPDLCLVPARSHPVTRDQVEQQLKKTGGTPFAIRNFSLEYSGDLFAPLAGLNRVRREFLARAEEMMIAHSHPSQNCIEQARQRWNDLKPEVIIPPPETSGTVPSSSLVLGVCTDSLLSVEMAAEAGCDCICFEPVLTPAGSSCRAPPGYPSFASQTITASRICREAGIRFVLRFPRITDNNYLDLVLPLLSQALSPDITEVMVENWDTVHALMHYMPACVLFGSPGLNIFNHEAVRHLPTCFGSVTLSPELSRDEIRLLIHGARQGIRTPSFALIVQGSVEAMVSENCLLQPWLSCNRKAGDPDTSRFFGIMDATGHTFPVRIDGECRTHIFNSAEICLIDHLTPLRQMGITTVLIDARGRTGTYTRDMIHLYQEAIQLAKKGVPANDPHFRYLKDAAKRIALGGITAGHFVRGLQES
ncbi:MAG: DUF3656 domain-containing protein, partial [Methanoregula sp.]|nr:DUF3656 domain-containing protein [Methanoregula sp.]